MAVKPDGELCNIREQIIEDLVSELTFQFVRNESGTTTMRVIGASLPFGNREIFFTPEGEHDGGGSFVQAPPPATWLRPVPTP